MLGHNPEDRVFVVETGDIVSKLLAEFIENNTPKRRQVVGSAVKRAAEKLDLKIVPETPFWAALQLIDDEDERRRIRQEVAENNPPNILVAVKRDESIQIESATVNEMNTISYKFVGIDDKGVVHYCPVFGPKDGRVIKCFVGGRKYYNEAVSASWEDLLSALGHVEKTVQLSEPLTEIVLPMLSQYYEERFIVFASEVPQVAIREIAKTKEEEKS